MGPGATAARHPRRPRKEPWTSLQTVARLASRGLGELIGTIPTATETQQARVEKIKKMSPAHIAPLAAFLATDEAREISGQIFGVRGKEIMLFGHHRPLMRIHRDDGWTVERLAEMFPGTLRQHLVPLETSGQYFNYDPLV